MRAVLVISERDNVATALEALEPGRQIVAGDGFVVAIDPIPAGHKIALRPIGAGTAVLKYGSSIGTAIGDIAAGSHVHTHNVASSRGRGDLESPAAPGLSRLAEPPDVTPIERTP
jgi:predicted RecA/RadA family phage recombinase